MPLTFSANIETEVEAAETGVVDLIEVDLGLGFSKFWSTTNVAIDWVVTEFGGPFEARILQIGSRNWVLGLDDDTLNLRIGNADGALSQIAKEFGIDVFEGAKVRNHRLFTSIKEIYRDYWVGEGLPMQWSEGECSWDIAFGIASFKQKFGRKIEFSCPHVFAGGPSSDCPYNLEKGIGVPEQKIVASATAGTSSIKVFVSGGGLSAASVGWFVYVRTNNAYYRITNLVSDTEIDVVFVIVGEGGSDALAINDTLFIGPPRTSCAKTPEECQEREMYGKYRGNVNGSGDKRRYFGGAAAASFVRFTGRLPNPEERFGHGSATRFARTSSGNDSLEGSTIPVVFGRYVLRDVPSIFVAPAGAFQHGYFILCEGEIFDFNVVDVNGFAVDNTRPRLSTLAEKLQHDPYIKWGTWIPDGMEDSRVGVSSDIAKQVREAIGRRIARGIKSNSNLDTYGDGTIGNPYLFSHGAGDGVSPHGLATGRIRIESQQDITTALVGTFAVTGLLTPLATGMPRNDFEIAALSFTGLTDPSTGPSILNYTVHPNPIQAAYAIMRNRRWGAGIPESKIDLPSVITESAFCEESIQTIESQGIVETGVVDTSSFECAGTPTRTWVIVPIDRPSGSLIGSQITFNKGTDKAFDAVIEENLFFDLIFNADIEAFDPGCPRAPIVGEAGFFGTILALDRPFIVGKEPTATDPYEMPVGRFVTRFKANGIIGNDAPITDIIQDVLNNCNGTFRSNGDKIEFLIRKKLSATEIDTVISDGIFTDRGVQRNITRNDGLSTMRVWREDEKTLGNFFTVDFQDQERDYQTSRVAVFNDAAQAKAAKLFGEEEGRLKITDSLNLIMTTSKDQAARLLALRARELFIQNLFCEFETSLKRGMKALPGDIIAVDSDTIAAHFNVQLLTRDVAIGNSFLFRILEKNEGSAYTIKFKCQVHVNPISENFATDFTQFFSPGITRRERSTTAAPTTPLAPSERVVIGSDDSVRSIINVKITYPKLDT